MWDSDSVSVTGTGEPERVEALDVTDGTLGLLARAAGDRPALHGRRRLAEGRRSG